MDDFRFHNDTRFYFGKNQLKNVKNELFGIKKVMIAFGEKSARESGMLQRIADIAESAGSAVVEFGGIAMNPNWTKVEEGAALAKDSEVDLILAVGGGAVMDCAKAVSIAAKQDKAWKKHWVRDDALIVDPIPCGFIVTAPGSGSEGNGIAQIINPKNGVSAGHDHSELRPRFVIMEPELSFSLTREQTVTGALETLSALMETYFSQPVGNVLADDLLEAAMKSVMFNLNEALERPDDYDARANLMMASAMAGNGMLHFGKEGIFQVRMIAQQVASIANCPIGLALAAIQPKYYRFIKVTSIFVTYQLKRFAVNVWGVDPEGKDDIDVAIEGVDAFEAWVRKIGAGNTLSQLGVTLEDVPKIAKSTTILPMKYCRLASDDIEILLEQCL